MIFDFHTYMLDCAARLKDIGHTEDTPKFARISGIGQLDEFLSNIDNIQFPALLIHNNQEGYLGDRNRSDNFLDSRYFVFYVVGHAKFENHDKQEAVKETCKNIGLKILARMVHEKRDMKNGLTFLDFTNVPYQTIGPVGDNCYGVMFSFTVTNTAEINYKTNDWV